MASVNVSQNETVMEDAGFTPSPPELVTGRDVELVVVGVLCLVAAAWSGLAIRPLQLVPVVIFLGLAAVSFGLAYWDVRSRGARPIRPLRALRRRLSP